MLSTSVKYSYQDLLSAPDDRNRYEIFEGKLIVTPSPTVKHQNASANLFGLIYNYTKTNKLGKIFSAPMDVYFDENTVVEPDLLFVSNERLHILEERRVNGAPDLVIEILSPGTAERDRGFKFRRYAQERIQEYWLVDPNEETLQIYMLGENGYNLFGSFKHDSKVSGSIFPDLSFYINELWQ